MNPIFVATNFGKVVFFFLVFWYCIIRSCFWSNLLELREPL